MKKMTLLVVLIAASTGCGRSWLPLFRGAPCSGVCGAPNLPPAPAAGCQGCEGSYGAGYADYNGHAAIGSGYYGGQLGETVLGETVLGETYLGPVNSGRIIGGATVPPAIGAINP